MVAGLRQGRYPVNPVGVNGLTPTQKKELPPGSRCPSTSSGRGLPERLQPREAEGEGARESSAVHPGRAEKSMRRVGEWSAYVRAVSP